MGRAPAPRPSPPALDRRPGEDNVGKRILLVEDEPLMALEIEDELRSRGFLVVGPARDIAGARRLIAEAAFEAALLDANLGGGPVDELAAALNERGIAFAFSTGYGREALPEAFRDAPILAKPFNARQLVETVEVLLRPRTDRPGRVSPSGAARPLPDRPATG